jgi:hypothetical protein
MVGYDENTILCPLCKGISNTYQPMLPVNEETVDLTPHIDFLSMLTEAPKRKPRQLLKSDIEKDPESFMLSVL